MTYSLNKLNLVVRAASPTSNVASPTSNVASPTSNVVGEFAHALGKIVRQTVDLCHHRAQLLKR
jgi:hypothetical protein